MEFVKLEYQRNKEHRSKGREDLLKRYLEDPTDYDYELLEHLKPRDVAILHKFSEAYVKEIAIFGEEPINESKRCVSSRLVQFRKYTGKEPTYQDIHMLSHLRARDVAVLSVYAENYLEGELVNESLV